MNIGKLQQKITGNKRLKLKLLYESDKIAIFNHLLKMHEKILLISNESSTNVESGFDCQFNTNHKLFDEKSYGFQEGSSMNIS